MKTKLVATPEDILARKEKGARLRDLRLRLRPDLTKVQFAALLGTSVEEVRQFEIGKVPIPDVRERVWCKIVGCEIADLQGAVGEPTLQQKLEISRREEARMRERRPDWLQAWVDSGVSEGWIQERERKRQTEEEERQRANEAKQAERDRQFDERVERMKARIAARPVPESVRKIMEAGGPMAGLAAMIMVAKGLRNGTEIVEQWAQQAHQPETADTIRQIAKDVGVGEPDEDDEV
jgi:transcriptional regulator with XRE-family HTH domain